MKKLLNVLLLVSFVITILVPLTGLQVHKLASVLFLLLAAVHCMIYREKMGAKRWLLLGLVVFSFLTGLFGMIFEQYPIILITHRVSSIGVVFFAAIHIFLFHRRILKK